LPQRHLLVRQDLPDQLGLQLLSKGPLGQWDPEVQLRQLPRWLQWPRQVRLDPLPQLLRSDQQAPQVPRLLLHRQDLSAPLRLSHLLALLPRLHQQDR
jgi:hypothetical protein